MIFQILDRQFNTLATMDNSLSGAIHFFDDEFHRYLNEGVSTFNFSVLRNHADTAYLVEGNYIYFNYKSRDYLMSIRRIEADEWQLDVETEDLSFSLLNEYAAAYTAPSARKIVDYLNDILKDSEVVIGLNEVASYTRKLEWTGESTVLERVLSIMTNFDAECEFITELNADRSLKQLTLNIYHKYDDSHQGVGVDRTDIELRFGKNVKTVKKTTDIRELYTCITPVGADGLTIKNKEATVKDDNGNVLFYTKKGSDTIYAPMANARFGRKQSEKGGYINMPYEYDTDNVETLYGNALSQLKKYSEPAVTYEVEGYYDLDVGDVVSIADDGYSPTLLLEARASEMIISFTSPEQNKTVFSNYRVFESQISDDLLDRMDKLKEDVDYAIQVAKTPIFKISTVGSTVFKNGEGSVKLIAAVERANADVTEEYSVFNWIKQNKDGSVDAEWSAAHEDFGTTLTISPDDFADTATFSYVAVKDGETFTGGGATVVKIFDGEDGADGVSVSSVVEEYYVSTSPTGQAGGSWSTTVPNNSDPNKYVWRRMKTTLSNGNESYTNPALIQGMTGIYPYIGPSQPANPKEGQQWWKSDASGNITDFLVYKSGSWQGQTIQQSILNIVKLNAVEITGSVITGTTINGSKFNTTFDFNPFPNGTVKRKGTMQIADAKTVIDYTTYDSNGNVNKETGNATYGEEGVNLSRTPVGDAAHGQTLQLSPYGLTMNVGTVGGTLRYQDVVTYPKTGIPASSGFTQYSSSSSSGNFPSAQRVGRVVQLAGAFKNNSELAGETGGLVMGILPVWARPSTNVNQLVQGTSANIYLLSVNTAGEIKYDRYRGNTSDGYNYKACGAGSWLNIATTYAAADMPE